MKKKTIETKDSKDEKLKLVIVNPDGKAKSDARKMQSKEFSLAISEGAPLRSVVNEYMRAQGLWNDEKEAELREYGEKLRGGERQLARGGKTADGKRFTKKDARQLAIDMGQWRLDQLRLLSTQLSVDAYTVEGRADNAYFDYLVSVCTKFTNGKPTFSSYDDYLSKAEEPYAFDAAQTLRDLIYGEQEDPTEAYPENKFLKKYKFVNEDGMLINEDGHTVSEDGKLIDNEGRFVDKKGNFVDVYGNPVDEEGSPIEEFVEFED